MVYRANFGDGSYSGESIDILDAKLAIWGRAAIVQYRSSVEISDDGRSWRTLLRSSAERNGPPIVEQREQ